MQVFVRSKICPDPCKWGYSYSIQNQKLDLFSTFYNHQDGFLKTSAETTSKVAKTEKKTGLRVQPLLFFFSSFLPPCSLFFSFPSVIFELVVCKSLPFSSFSFKWLQVSLKVRFQKTARYISLHIKKLIFLTGCSAASDLGLSVNFV